METEQKKWFAFEVVAQTSAAEAVEFALNQLDALGTEINHLGKDKSKETLCVVGYFNEQISDEITRSELDEALRIYEFSSDAVEDTRWRDVENTDWLAEWKKHWKPTITDKFIIAPTWEKVEDAEKIIIYIEPNMAFGTGTHETTKLCLQAIGENFHPGMTFLDVGTGTGILIIAAAKLKSKNQSPKSKTENSLTPDYFQGCDTDEDSIKIAKENLALNGVANADLFVGSISDETPEFDFVCANLTADVILPMLELLVQKARKILVLSGILKIQENSVTDKLDELGISAFEVQTDGEWISIVVKKDIEN